MGVHSPAGPRTTRQNSPFAVGGEARGEFGSGARDELLSSVVSSPADAHDRSGSIRRCRAKACHPEGGSYSTEDSLSSAAPLSLAAAFPPVWAKESREEIGPPRNAGGADKGGEGAGAWYGPTLCPHWRASRTSTAPGPTGQACRHGAVGHVLPSSNRPATARLPAARRSRGRRPAACVCKGESSVSVCRVSSHRQIDRPKVSSARNVCRPDCDGRTSIEAYSTPPCCTRSATPVSRALVHALLSTLAGREKQGRIVRAARFPCGASAPGPPAPHAPVRRKTTMLEER